MFLSGLSGNEIYCLSLKGFTPGELTVGNCVNSMGVMGGIASAGRSFAGGEIKALTDQISEGRHLAINRMEEEAKKHGAAGVTGVAAELRTLASYQEFLAQGTAVHSQAQVPFFSTAASGIELYCHLDAGFTPRRFSMGNIAYALGVARGLTGSLSTMTRGEVKEYSQMYNEIRHLALARLREDAAKSGSNAVVDAEVRVIGHANGLEFLITGTASHHDKIGNITNAAQVVTSTLSGEEVWNLAKLGYAPRQLVMATSVYSLGVVGGIGAMFKAMTKGEIPEVTHLVYEARENCLELLRAEAQSLGAAMVIGNRLKMVELQPGLIELFALGTAVVLRDDMTPHSPALIPQAVITESESLDLGSPVTFPGIGAGARRGQQVKLPPICGCIIAFIFVLIPLIGGLFAALSKPDGSSHPAPVHGPR
jgi:uncharacterized protein YbjQ (UPF0145 family)